MKSQMLIETVCAHVREWTGVRRPTWRKLYTNAKLLLYMSWDRDFVYIYIYIYIYSAIFNCLGVYFIVCSGTGPWARVRSFRLLRGPTVSRAFGEFE